MNGRLVRRQTEEQHGADLHAYVYRPMEGNRLLPSQQSGWGLHFDFEIPLVGKGRSGNEQAVFVAVGEIAQGPHRSTCGRAAIWLEVVEDRPKGKGRHPAKTGGPLIAEVRPVSGHRELDLSCLSRSQFSLTAFPDEAPSEVVEGRTEVVKRFPNEQAGLPRDFRRPDNEEGRDAELPPVRKFRGARSLHIEGDIGLDGVGMKGLHNLGVESVELTLAPIQLGPTIGKGVAHDS
jgi:hypothetical protein